MAYVYRVTSDSTEPTEWQFTVRRESDRYPHWELLLPDPREVPEDIRTALHEWLGVP